MRVYLWIYLSCPTHNMTSFFLFIPDGHGLFCYTAKISTYHLANNCLILLPLTIMHNPQHCWLILFTRIYPSLGILTASCQVEVASVLQNWSNSPPLSTLDIGHQQWISKSKYLEISTFKFSFFFQTSIPGVAKQLANFGSI